MFMDQSQAFDTLDRKILIDELQHCGLTGISLMWFESCLPQRIENVEINNFKSS